MTVCIERKEGQDFISSMYSGRLFQQLKQMQQFDSPLLCVVENNLWKYFYFNKNRGVHKSYYGALRKISTEYKIPVMLFHDQDDFLRFLSSFKEPISVDDREPKDIPTSLKRRKCKVTVERLLIGDYMIELDDSKTNKKPTQIFRKPKSVAERQENTVCCCANVSVATARLLLERFHNPQNVFKASIEELMSVKGIGKKTAIGVHNVGKERYNRK